MFCHLLRLYWKLSVEYAYIADSLLGSVVRPLAKWCGSGHIIERMRH